MKRAFRFPGRQNQKKRRDGGGLRRSRGGKNGEIKQNGTSHLTKNPEGISVKRGGGNPKDRTCGWGGGGGFLQHVRGKSRGKSVN